MPVAKRGAVLGCALLLSLGSAATAAPEMGSTANAVPPPGDTSLSASGMTPAGGTSVTLITGDRVIVNGDHTTVDPAEGRNNIRFISQEAEGHHYVIPSDAAPLVHSGVLDERLFDITTLLEFGYDDANANEMPLIVRQSGDASALSGATVSQSLPAIGGSSIRASKGSISEFWNSVRPTSADAQALNSGVQHIWLDGKREAVLDRSAAQIGAPQAWKQNITGQGVTVAVLDTGVDETHPDLADRETGQRNFTNAPTPEDKFGHGTHVAGIVAGTGKFSNGKYRGIAHGANILDGKVLNDSGSGMESGIIAGMQWAADQKADIANLSLGGGDAPGIDPLEEAVNSLSKNTDTLFVIAAGNSGPGEETVGSPGSADAALTVGAVNDQDGLAQFSSRGPRIGDGGIKPDITAPGVGIVSALHSAGTIGKPIDGRYTSLDGTSMATPHVAGVAALVAQARPDLAGEQLKALLTSSAKPNPNLSPFEQGSGRVDVPAALAQAVVSEQSSLSFGTQRWPHNDDKPVAKPLTYRNTSDKPVTLDLAVQGVGPDGQPAPEGLFTLDKQRVTVPPGGTAKVTVTADTRVDAPDGVYSGTVTATSGNTAVATPTAVVKEVESYDLTVNQLGKDGQPARQAMPMLINAETGEVEFLPFTGKGTTRVPKGKYVLSSNLSGGTPQNPSAHMLVHPGIDLSRNQTVTMDFREAKPITINPPYPGSKPEVSVFGFRFTSSSGASFGSSVLGTTFEGMTLGHVGPSDPNLAASISTEGTSDKGRYALAWFERERVPNGYQQDVRPEDMATVHHEIGSPIGKSRGHFGSTPSLGDLSQGLTMLQPGALPNTVTTHYNTEPGVHWNGLLMQEGQNRAVEIQLEGPPRRYEAGQEAHTRYNFAPFAPGNPKSLMSGGGSRTGNELLVQFPLFTDGAGNGGIAEAKGKTELYRDGEQVASMPNPGLLSAMLPPESGQYRLTTEANRERELSPHISATWTFTSAETPTLESLPLLAVRFQPELDDTNSAPAGKHQDVPVFVQGADGAVVTPTDLTVEVSYDQGKTWTAVPVQDGKIGLDYPADATTVSLRASASDDQGNTVEHTVISAYKLKR